MVSRTDRMHACISPSFDALRGKLGGTGAVPCLVVAIKIGRSLSASALLAYVTCSTTAQSVPLQHSIGYQSLHRVPVMGPLKGKRSSRKIPMRSQRGRATAHASRPIDSLLPGATRRLDLDCRGERSHGKPCRADEQHHTLPVTAAATARMTPAADNPPTTEASQRTSRSSSHHRVSMTLLQRR